MITKRDSKGRIKKGSNLKHGLSSHAVYDTWIAMRARCNNSSHPMFKHYGGRGIGVCESWNKSFYSFINDMGMRPSEKHSIERIDVNGNYEPSNCKWETMHRQQLNRRNNNECPGVHYEKPRNKWHADIAINGKKVFLGRFVNFLDAAKARKAAEETYAI